MICGVNFNEINLMLTQSVAIQSFTTSRLNGGVSSSWSTGSTVKGRYSPLSGEEMAKFDKIDKKIDGKIYLIKGSSVSSDNKLVLDSISYDVIFVKNPVSADEFIVCYVKSNGKV